jgi:hypothetical protein
MRLCRHRSVEDPGDATPPLAAGSQSPDVNAIAPVGTALIDGQVWSVHFGPIAQLDKSLSARRPL